MRELFSRLTTGVVMAAICGIASAKVEPVEPLQMRDKHPTVSRNVSRLIEELHYSQPELDNSLSSAILDRYLDMLDSNRMYFMASDVAGFGRYRYELDERAKSGELEPVYEVFNLFRERTRERVNYALELLETQPDFSIEESFRFDRSELGWPLSEDEMKELWRKKVKSDALNLLLTEQSWEEVVEVLTERYERLYKRVSQLNSDDVFETFMNAVAHTVDPHSSYLSPRNSEEYRIQMSLSYDGIGASLQTEDDYVKIVEIIPGGPAQIDGQLKPEDRIVAVGEGEDGEMVDVIGWRLDDVVQMIRGPGGSVVRLDVLPAGTAPGSPTRVIELVRDEVKLEEQAAKSEMIEVPLDEGTYKVGVITVPSFYQDFAARSRGDEDYTSTSRDVARLIEDLEAQGVDGLIVDLRQNGGGHLSEATELSGLFIERGPVVQLRETHGNVQVLDDPTPNAVYDGPLAVLVNRYSASASEIFAAAIQDYGRGVIIGQQTFGKGTVQNLFNLDRVMRGSDNGQLTLTIGKYYRVTGKSTQNRGVIPDIELPSRVDMNTVGESTRDTALPWDQIEGTGYDPQASLQDAISVLLDRQSSHSAQDPNFAYLLEDVAAVEKLRNQHTVSLSLAERRAERDAMDREQLARENARRQALGLEPLADLEALAETAETDASAPAETEGATPAEPEETAPDGSDDAQSRATPETLLLEQATRVVAEMVALARAGTDSRRLASEDESAAARALSGESAEARAGGAPTPAR